MVYHADDKFSNIAIISNYNTNPKNLISKFDSFLLFDQSDKLETIKYIAENYPETRFVDNPGHSLRNYFEYIIENYDNLPNQIWFLKSNLIGRHIDVETFEEKIKKIGLIPLFNEVQFKDKKRIAHHLMPGYFIERNNSWFVDEHKSKYFLNADTLLRYLFVNPILPAFMLFAPGANYGVDRNRILMYPINFWKALSKIVSYSYFPAESYIVERILFIIFSAEYKHNELNFDQNWSAKLDNQQDLVTCQKNKRIKQKNNVPKRFNSRIQQKIINKLIFLLDKNGLI